MALSAPALAATGNADLQATITVTNPPTNCTLNVTSPQAPMAATWTYAGGGAQASALTVTGTEPPEVRVSIAGDAACNLNSLHLTTVVANADTAANQDYARVVHYTRNGGAGTGYWRFIPYLAQAKFYTDDAFTTQGAYADIEYDDPSPQGPVTFDGTASHHAGEDMTDLSDAAYKFLTETYVQGGGRGVAAVRER